jgi:putative NADH-flavin reductase
VKVVVFGASGQTGRLLVEQALAAGHEVTAFVRDPAKLSLQHERLRVVQGDVQDAGAVAGAVAGQDAVLSALGPAKPAFNSMTLGARHILAGMREHGVRRLVTITGAGVPDPHDRPGPLNQAISFLLKRINPEVLADAQRHVDQVRASDVDWTIVRVGRLTDGPKTGAVRVGWVGVNTKPFVSRADAAAFMLAQLTDPAHLRQAPMISG